MGRLTNSIVSKIDRTYRPPENGVCPFCRSLACRISMCCYVCLNCRTILKTPEGLHDGWDCKNCAERVGCLPLADVILPFLNLGG